MSDPRPFDSFLDAAREASRAGEWARVRELLEHRDDVLDDGHGITLLAAAYLRLGLPERARLWLDRVIPTLERRADRPALRRAVNMLGAACFELGEIDAAELAWERALVLAQADGDDLLLARATNNLGAVANVRGRREKALGMYQLAIPAYQRLGSATGIAECYHNMAITYRDQRELERADEYERRAIEFAGGAANERLVALGRLGLAEITYRRGDTALAVESARRVAREFARLVDPIRQADALRLSGAALGEQGRHEEARTEIERALGLARAHGGALIEAEALRALAEVSRSEGKIDEARRVGHDAVTAYARLDAAAELREMEQWMASLPNEI